MFWSTSEETSLDILLKSENIELRAVLEDPYTLQELRNSNKALVQYLVRDEVLSQMLSIALRPELDESLPLKLRYRHSHMCTEMLTVHSTELNNALIGNERNLGVILESLEGQMNSVVASFFMKIITHLFGRDTSKLLDRLIPSSFISAVMSQLNLSAMAECLLRVLTIPNETELTTRTMEWYTETRFVEALITLLSPAVPSIVHYNVAYLYSEIIRSLRDVLYSTDERAENVLLAKMQSEEMVGKLIDAMLEKNENGRVCESVVMNGYMMLEALLETNFILNRPSHQLEGDRVDVWLGGIPDTNAPDEHQVWQADRERVVEGVVASRCHSIMATAIHELSFEDGDAWMNLLSLVVDLIDTNHRPTQEAVHEAWKKVPLKELIILSITRPQLSILHALLLNIIQFVLHSACTPETPLLVYLFNDADIVSVVWRGLQSSPPISHLAMISRRSFLFSIGCALHHARSNGPNREHVDGILKACARWPDLYKEVAEWSEKNKSAVGEGGAPSVASSRFNNIEMEVPVEQSNSHHAQSLLHEFESKSPCQTLPSHQDLPLSQMSLPLDAACYSAETRMEVDIMDPFNEDCVDESSFEKLCTLRCEDADATQEEWPRSATADQSTDWPGAGEGSKDSADAKDFPLQWDNSQIRGQDLVDDWPAAGAAASGKAEASDGWAAEGEWQGAMDPVMAGFASGLISAGIDKSNSEC